MRRLWGVSVAALAAAALAGAAPAGAAQGSDAEHAGPPPGAPNPTADQAADYAQYTADAGETNALQLSLFPGGYVHLEDPGATIRWFSPPPPLAHCEGASHDVACLTDARDLALWADLGDGNDSFVNNTAAAMFVKLGPGNDRAVGGTADDHFVGGRGADDIRGGGLQDVFLTVADGADSVDYSATIGPLNVSADDLPDDGVAGEHDNIHSDITEVIGGPFDDVITGYGSAVGGAGNDTIVLGSAPLYSGPGAEGGDGDDTITGGPGPDEVSGGAGNDQIDVRGGGADHVSCGTGSDTVLADSSDLVASDCEDVQVSG